MNGASFSWGRAGGGGTKQEVTKSSEEADVCCIWAN